MDSPLDLFLARADPHGAVLELGTLRWGDRSTCVGDSWFTPSTWVRTDIEAGVDVDVVADAHDLAPFGDATFDTVISRSVWEHMPRPWLAAQAAARVLRPGGLLFVDVPCQFPIHGYPDDFWRFTTSALEVILTDAGLDVVATESRCPARVVPAEPVDDWNTVAEGWLYTSATAVKP